MASTGNLRGRLLVAAKTAFAIAGTMSDVPVSPIRPGGSALELAEGVLPAEGLVEPRQKLDEVPAVAERGVRGALALMGQVVNEPIEGA